MTSKTEGCCRTGTMKIHIAHSPDSDDAFMFYGLASGKVPSNGFELEHVLSDIETLNRAAFEGRYEITAVSFHAYAHLTDRYILLPHGASMGDRYGPVVVAKTGGPTSLNGVRVAIPGELTTAFLALRLYDPGVQYVVMPFDKIQEAVHAGEIAAGLLIHEGQVTYEEEGLQKIVDLGEWWADRRHASTPTIDLTWLRWLPRCPCRRRCTGPRRRIEASGALRAYSSVVSTRAPLAPIG